MEIVTARVAASMLVLFLGFFSMSGEAASSSCVKTVRVLQRTCPKLCIRFDRRRRCYTCLDNCKGGGNGNIMNDNDSCNATTYSSSCGNNQMCVASGVVGSGACINYIREGGYCDMSGDDNEDSRGNVRLSRLRNTARGIFERKRISSIAETTVPCQNGLVCRRESLDRSHCRENSTTCYQNRLTNSEIECDEEGNYRPQQCKTLTTQGGGLMCRCVSMNGTTVGGSERSVRSRDNAPDCDRSCSSTSRQGSTYQAASGTRFVDYNKCSRCLCRAGEPSFCTSENNETCNRLNPRSRNCMFRGRTIANKETISIGCKKCGCYFGKLKCLRKTCEDQEDDDPVDEEDRRCRLCKNVPVSFVCGADGKTYPSICEATNCRGLNSSDITRGRCRERDICQEYSCNDTETCIRRGGVTCLSKSGCAPRHLRSCVDLDNLRCGFNQSEGNPVCGSDGNTYSSTCHLLQQAAGVNISYGERCNDVKCSGGQVCGTDGETYDNICELRAQSANSRVDYRGECMETDPETQENRCRKIRNSKKCKEMSNCKTVIQPGDGCCPICGGGLTLRFDDSSLEDYSAINPSVATVDDVMTEILLSGFISEEDQGRCDIHGSLSNKGDFFIALESNNTSEDYCMKLSEKLANVLNNPTQMGTTSSDSVSVSIPQVFQFATVAESSPVISEGPTTSSSGIPQGKSISSTVLAIFFLAMFFI